MSCGARKSPGFVMLDLLLGLSLYLTLAFFCLPLFSSISELSKAVKLNLASQAMSTFASTAQQKVMYQHEGIPWLKRNWQNPKELQIGQQYQVQRQISMAELGLGDFEAKSFNTSFIRSGNATGYIHVAHRTDPGYSRMLIFQPVTGRMVYADP